MASLMAAPAYAGETTNDIPTGTVPTIGQPAAEAPAAEAPAPANNAPVWAEGQNEYAVTDDPVTLDLKASDADNDHLTYAGPNNWNIVPAEGGVTATYVGPRPALGETAQFTVTDGKSEPVTLDVALQRAAPEAPAVETATVAEPYALRKGFRLGAEYNFMSVKNGANYNTAGLRAAYDIPLKENVMLAIVGGVGYANQGETRETQFSSTNETLIDTESGMRNIGDGQYLNFQNDFYQSSETTGTWEEGRNGGYATLGANVEFGKKLRFNTGLEGSVLFGSFADERTDVTTTTVREEMTSYISENGEPITDVMVDTAENAEITQSSAMYGNNVFGTLAIPARISYDAGNFNLSAGVAGGLMFNNGAQPYFGAGANVTYRFGNNSEE